MFCDVLVGCLLVLLLMFCDVLCFVFFLFSQFSLKSPVRVLCCVVCFRAKSSVNSNQNTIEDSVLVQFQHRLKSESALLLLKLQSDHVVAATKLRVRGKKLRAVCGKFSFRHLKFLASQVYRTLLLLHMFSQFM